MEIYSALVMFITIVDLNDLTTNFYLLELSPFTNYCFVADLVVYFWISPTNLSQVTIAISLYLQLTYEKALVTTFYLLGWDLRSLLYLSASNLPSKIFYSLFFLGLALLVLAAGMTWIGCSGHLEWILLPTKKKKKKISCLVGATLIKVGPKLTHL